MKKINFIILICFAILFTTCNKRPFANIEIHGNIISSITNQPLTAQIQVWVGEGRPGEKGTTNFDNSTTNADGTFDIKSKAQWEGNKYTLVIIPDSERYQPKQLSYPIAKHQDLDVGTIEF